jgi:hypothetical protein
MEDGYQSMMDLLGSYRIIPRQGKTERGELLDYFSKEIERPVRFVAVRTSHYTLDQLYALRSSFKDRLNRNGRETARKWWWWITKTKSV